MGASGLTPLEYPESQRREPESFEVVYGPGVYERCHPSLDAEILRFHVAGDVLQGIRFELDGIPWLQLLGSGPGYVLVDASETELDLGILLLPVSDHGKDECQESDGLAETAEGTAEASEELTSEETQPKDAECTDLEDQRPGDADSEKVCFLRSSLRPSGFSELERLKKMRTPRSARSPANQQPCSFRVCEKVVIRSQPSTESEMLGIAKKGDIVHGSQRHGWLQLSSNEGWMLIDGRALGHGKLLERYLRPPEILQVFGTALEVKSVAAEERASCQLEVSSGDKTVFHSLALAATLVHGLQEDSNVKVRLVLPSEGDFMPAATSDWTKVRTTCLPSNAENLDVTGMCRGKCGRCNCPRLMTCQTDAGLSLNMNLTNMRCLSCGCGIGFHAVLHESSAPQPKARLRILALHGRGDNSNVMRAQVAELKRRLSVAGCECEWHFMDGTEETDAPADSLRKELGQGLPFKVWFKQECSDHSQRPYIEKLSDPSVVFSYDKDDVRSAVQKLEDYINAGEPFDVVLGFSQGCAMISLLSGFLRSTCKKDETPLPWKLTVLFNGTKVRDQHYQDLLDRPFAQPAVLVFGRTDPFFEYTRDALPKMYENPVILEHEEGHKFPTAPPLADAIYDAVVDNIQLHCT